MRDKNVRGLAGKAGYGHARAYQKWSVSSVNARLGDRYLLG